jgi:uncharacterized membrane protein YheB (UPF0754 family)
MDVKDIKFISPVNKGEEFTFKQVITLNKNQEALDKFIKNSLNEKFEDYKSIAKSQMKEALETQLIKETERAKKIIALKEKDKVSTELNELKGKLSSFDKMQQEILKAKDSEITNAHKQNTKLQETLEKMNSEFTKSYNDNLQKEIARIQDEFKAKELELMASKKFANVIGEKAEEDIKAQLIEAFSNDKISKPNHATGGADIHQEIFDSNKKIGSILYEIKNKKV